MSKKITDENFKEFISEGVTLIDFWAEWCGPCRMLGPIVDELSKDYEGVGKMNVDENSKTMSELGIRNIPTVLIYKDGIQVDKHVGMAQKQQLQDLINKHLD